MLGGIAQFFIRNELTALYTFTRHLIIIIIIRIIIIITIIDFFLGV